MTRDLSTIELRPLQPGDDLEALTRLLNAAYKKLADQGFLYVASYQDAQRTKTRIDKGQCFVLAMEEKLVGTILYFSPQRASGCAWYDQPFTASYGQFAVDPTLQKSGLGSRLIDHVEALAKADGAQEIAIDTSEGAAELIAFYSKRGYRFIEHVQWEETNYRSVILSKKLI